MHFEPDAADLLPALAAVNAVEPTYRPALLPIVAAGMAAVWLEGGGRSLPFRKQYWSVYEAAILPEALERGISGLDAFHGAVGRTYFLMWRQAEARGFIASGLYPADHPVRFCSDMSCARARARHGRIVPLETLLGLPLPGCDMLGCRCSIMIHPRGVYRD